MIFFQIARLLLSYQVFGAPLRFCVAAAISSVLNTDTAGVFCSDTNFLGIFCLELQLVLPRFVVDVVLNNWHLRSKSVPFHVIVWKPEDFEFFVLYSASSFHWSTFESVCSEFIWPSLEWLSMFLTELMI